MKTYLVSLRYVRTSRKLETLAYIFLKSFCDAFYNCIKHWYYIEILLPLCVFLVAFELTSYGLKRIPRRTTVVTKLLESKDIRHFDIRLLDLKSIKHIYVLGTNLEECRLCPLFESVRYEVFIVNQKGIIKHEIKTRNLKTSQTVKYTIQEFQIPSTKVPINN